MLKSEYRIDPPQPDVPVLLTPGPLTTAGDTKAAMLRDWGSRDAEFITMTAEIRRRLLELAGCRDGEFQCVPVQGSGTFAVESMLGTMVPRDGKALVLANGAYGARAAAILARIGREHVVIDKGDYLPPLPDEVDAALSADASISHVVVIHCETSSGILNPLAAIAEVTRRHDRRLLVDGMSAFGAIPLDAGEVRFEAMAASSNKCLEGVPGFGFVIARTGALEKAEGNCHSLSLDAHAQWQGFNRNGQWRFTPPTHVVAAFLQALRDHEREGGVQGRGGRYSRNRDVLLGEMRRMGFETLLVDRWLSPIIVTFFSPADPRFDFNRFYQLIGQRGFLIYPGKLTAADSFRIGCVGHIDEDIIRGACGAIEDALDTLGVADRSPPAERLAERQLLERI